MDLGQVELNKMVQKVDRNRQIVIDCNLKHKGNFVIQAQREVVLKDAEGNEVNSGGENGEGKYVIHKRLSEVVNETVVLPAEAGGLTLTGGQIAMALELLSDQFATPEAANPPDPALED